MGNTGKELPPHRIVIFQLAGHIIKGIGQHAYLVIPVYPDGLAKGAFGYVMDGVRQFSQRFDKTAYEKPAHEDTDANHNGTNPKERLVHRRQVYIFW